MKKFLSLFLPIIALIFSSCTPASSNDTYFIHAAAFEKESDEYTIYALFEKAEETEENFFTAASSGKSIEEATNKLKNEYKDCYFATATVYLISDNAEKSLIFNLAKEICGGNIYPSKSNIICIKQTNTHDFIESIRNEDDLKKVLALFENHPVNAVRFFSRYFSGKRVSLPALKLDGNKKPISWGSGIFRDNTRSKK